MKGRRTSPSGQVAQALKPGMIVSNEPGYYKAGEYGIRIENLIVVTELPAMPGGERAMMGFETITLAPIDLNLVDVGLLIDDERAWLNAYHARVREVADAAGGRRNARTGWNTRQGRCDMIVEMRTYKVKPGTRAKLLEALRGKRFDELKRIGVKVAGTLCLHRGRGDDLLDARLSRCGFARHDERPILWRRGVEARACGYLHAEPRKV